MAPTREQGEEVAQRPSYLALIGSACTTSAAITFLLGYCLRFQLFDPPFSLQLDTLHVGYVSNINQGSHTKTRSLSRTTTIDFLKGFLDHITLRIADYDKVSTTPAPGGAHR